MDLQLNGRVVIVTGAAAGIGQATAGLLTAEGAVVEVDRADRQLGQGWSMRGHHDGTALNEPGQGLDDESFGLDVEAGGRFVQKNDGGVEE